jgi:hypothetical protein
MLMHLARTTATVLPRVVAVAVVAVVVAVVVVVVAHPPLRPQQGG